MHLAKGDAHGLDVFDRHAFHARAFKNEHLLRRARPNCHLSAAQVLDAGNRTVLPGDHGHALVAARSDHVERLLGGNTKDGGGYAEYAEIDRTGDHPFLHSVGPSNGITSTR